MLSLWLGIFVLAIVVGTRPEIIKMSPVIRECIRRDVDFFVIHTGQHYSYEMDRIFFEELELPLPEYSLDVGSGTHAEQTAKIMIGVEKVLLDTHPSVVLVQGDTNTTLGAALAAVKLHIPVGHIEAGLRSFDREMPEEINRILVDRVSDYLFAPTEDAKSNLLREGINESRIFVTGNTIVDAVYQNLEIVKRRSSILKTLGLKRESYFLATFHRQENVDKKHKLQGILEGLSLVFKEFSLPIIVPLHPRTRKRINEFGISLPEGIVVVNPVGFLEFLELEANARLVLTDSGGVQEETCILKVPCVTLRENTERPETLRVGSNILVGTDPQKILEGVRLMLKRKRSWPNPFGDGSASKKIIDILLSQNPAHP